MKINTYVLHGVNEDIFKIPYRIKAARIVEDFVEMLEDDVFFENEVNRIRKLHNITKFPSKKETKNKLANILEDLLRKELFRKENAQLLKDARALCRDYNLSDSLWVIPFYSYIKYDGMFLPILDEDFGVSITSERKPLYLMGDDKEAYFLEEVYIRLCSRIGKTKLLKLVDKNYDKIEKEFDKIEAIQKEKKAQSLPRIKIHSRNIKIYKKIFQLRNKKKSYAQIGKAINDEFELSLNDVEVRNMMQRYKRALKNLHGNK